MATPARRYESMMARSSTVPSDVHGDGPVNVWFGGSAEDWGAPTSRARHRRCDRQRCRRRWTLRERTSHQAVSLLARRHVHGGAADMSAHDGPPQGAVVHASRHGHDDGGPRRGHRLPSRSSTMLRVWCITARDTPGSWSSRSGRGLVVPQWQMRSARRDACDRTGGDDLAAAREQWDDGNNVRRAGAGVVIAYERNTLTNEHLRRAVSR